MSRYSRNFDDAQAAKAHDRGSLGYTRYRDLPRVAAKKPCQICDGDGIYLGAAGPVPCGLCEGSGRVDAETMEEVVLFRTRHRGA